MSKYYDEDDMYDYDDYDQEYEEQYDQSSYGGNSYDIVAVESAGTSRGSTEPPSDYVQFVMEALGTVEMTAAGRRVGVISEARVLQMLEAFSYDSDATISHFLTQREASKVTTIKTVKAKAVVAPISTVTAGPAKKLTQGELKKKAKEEKSVTAKISPVSSLDVSAMGFAVESLKESSFTVKAATVTAASAPTAAAGAAANLITSSAALSDDEYESSSSAKEKEEITASHITMVVAGHVDAGKSTLVGE